MLIIFICWLFLIRGLAGVGFPHTFTQDKVGKNSFKRRVFGAAGIYAKVNFVLGFKKMTYPHLMKSLSVPGIFYTKIIFSAAQSVPHGFYVGMYFCSCPVGISVICIKTFLDWYSPFCQGGFFVLNLPGIFKNYKQKDTIWWRQVISLL